MKEDVPGNFFKMYVPNETKQRGMARPGSRPFKWGLDRALGWDGRWGAGQPRAEEGKTLGSSDHFLNAHSFTRRASAFYQKNENPSSVYLIGLPLAHRIEFT